MTMLFARKAEKSSMFQQTEKLIERDLASTNALLEELNTLTDRLTQAAGVDEAGGTNRKTGSSDEEV